MYVHEHKHFCSDSNQYFGFNPLKNIIIGKTCGTIFKLHRHIRFCKYHPICCITISLDEELQLDVNLLKSVRRLAIASTSNLHQTAEVSQVVDEVKQLADVVRYRRTVGIHSL